MRCIIRNIHDRDGITDEILSQLEKKFALERAIVLDVEKSEKRDEKLEYKPLRLAMCHNCIEFLEMEGDIPRFILEGMLPYKAMAMHMLMRESHYDIYSFHYLEQVYYRHVKYWNNLLEKERIDFLLYLVTPHHAGEYILYALAKVRKIPTALFAPITPIGHFVSGTSIENVGYTIEKIYKEGITERKLGEDFSAFVDRVDNASTFTAKEKKAIQLDTKKAVFSYNSSMQFWRRLLKVPYIKFSPKYKNHRDFYLQEQCRLTKLTWDTIRYERKMDHLADYEKIAVEPDWNEKFIYFSLQQTPEETTMPRAGEYKNQMLSIETLACAASALGLKVYVKEHWVQPHREPGFYKELSEIPGVTLINLEVPAAELIHYAIAVSTQTGTCILEAMLMQKCTLYFGEGQPFKGAPGAIKVDDSKQAQKVIADILNKTISVSKREAMNYMQAMEQACICSYVDLLSETTRQYDKKETAKKIVAFIQTLA